MLAAAAAGCGGKGVPEHAPDIRGVVTSDAAERILVEAEPGSPSGGPKALVRIEPHTRIFMRSGGGAPEEAVAGAVRAGQTVSVWYSGPILESYPVQVTAEAVVIDLTEESVPDSVP